jgi:hypothetical protein
VVECLPSMNEALGFIPSMKINTYIQMFECIYKDVCVATYIYNPLIILILGNHSIHILLEL